jgi:hypothetical protein
MLEESRELAEAATRMRNESPALHASKPYRVVELAPRSAHPSARDDAELLSALEFLIEFNETIWDEGPSDEGWQSDKLVRALETMRRFRDNLKEASASVSSAEREGTNG